MTGNEERGPRTRGKGKRKKEKGKGKMDVNHHGISDENNRRRLDWENENGRDGESVDR